MKMHQLTRAGRRLRFEALEHRLPLSASALHSATVHAREAMDHPELQARAVAIAPAGVRRDESLVAAGHAMLIQRPIEEFVATQGTFCFPDGSGGCVLVLPPLPNLLGWADGSGRVGWIDYAGVADKWIRAASGGQISFRTSFDGSVTERTQVDGTAELRVTLYTRHALTFIVEGADLALGPLLFGHRASEVLAGLNPSFANSVLEVTMIVPRPGLPIPDLVDILSFNLSTRFVKSIGFRAAAEGELGAAFGVPDGMPGTAQFLVREQAKAIGADFVPVAQIRIRTSSTLASKSTGSCTINSYEPAHRFPGDLPATPALGHTSPSIKRTYLHDWPETLESLELLELLPRGLPFERSDP